uniref:Uncharacterized protein n=1 Tax=Arundo donax TaxID=35708 RepID=A0A0A9EQ80_ARUDO
MLTDMSTMAVQFQQYTVRGLSHIDFPRICTGSWKQYFPFDIQSTVTNLIAAKTPSNI